MKPLQLRQPKKYLEKNNLKCNLAFIKSNFGFLPKSITFLEKKGIKLSDSLKTVEEKNKIVDLKCTKGKAVVKKLNYVLEKNPGCKSLLKISKILSGEVEDMEGLTEGLISNDLVYFIYAPMSSVDVENVGSFSVFKIDTFENIRKYLLCSVIFKVKKLIK